MCSYFPQNLSTKYFGRLVIYADVMTSSYDVLGNLMWHHGLAVIPRSQTKGTGKALFFLVILKSFCIIRLQNLYFSIGRGKNVWLSPDGCAMFTLQLYIPLNSVIGERLSLIQHITIVAIVNAVKSIPGYEVILIHFLYFFINIITIKILSKPFSFLK